MRKPLILSLLLCTLLSSGCALTSDAINTADVAAAGNERYHTLVQKAFDGEADLEKDAIAPITKDEWKGTPKSVQILVDRLLNGLGANLHAFRSISFQLGGGVDPDTLEKPKVTPPEVDESAGLIDGNGENQ